MSRKQLRFGKGFKVVMKNPRAQAATMVIAPRDAEGGPGNRHRGSDQWLYVLSGTGRATLGRRRQPLKPGTLLLIERGTTHEIRNTGRTPLKTLNLYVPPAYTDSGDPLPHGKP
jgi:mannose-6-phosphate isomerase-like protein (cupin superfamily)